MKYAAALDQHFEKFEETMLYAQEPIMLMINRGADFEARNNNQESICDLLAKIKLAAPEHLGMVVVAMNHKLLSAGTASTIKHAPARRTL